jgi:hypothetical protein
MILIAILLVGGAFVVAEYRNKTAEIVYTEPVVSTSTDLQNLSDSTDWKKILLANDKATTTVKDLTKSKEKLTPTDLIARDFFAKYMAASESGIADDAQVQQDIINKVLSSDAILPNPTLYTSKDIKFITNDQSQAAQNKYVADVSLILKNYFPVAGTSEPEIAKSSFDNNNPSILAQIDPKIDGYKKTLNGLLSMTVPTSAMTSHINLVNAMSKMLYVAEGLRKSGIDPLRGVQGMSLYIDANTSLMASLDNLNSISQ